MDKINTMEFDVFTGTRKLKKNRKEKYFLIFLVFLNLNAV